MWNPSGTRCGSTCRESDHARIVFDKFFTSPSIWEARWYKVRRKENKILRADGDRHAGVERRYDWLRHPARMEPRMTGERLRPVRRQSSLN